MIKPRFSHALLCTIFCVSISAAKEIVIPDIVIHQQPLVKAELSSMPQQTLRQNNVLKNELKDWMALAYGSQTTDFSGTGNQSAISLRGFGDDANLNTLILLNGIPLRTANNSILNSEWLDGDDLSAITIAPGSYSVRYGDQAVGGIVNLVTTRKRKPGWEAQLAHGSFSENSAGILFSKDWPSLHMLFKIRDEHKDHDRDNNAENRRNIHLSLSKGWHVDYFYTRSHLEYPGALTEAQVTENRQQSKHPGDFSQQTQHLLTWQHKTHLAPHWFLQNNLLFRTMDGTGVLTNGFSEKSHQTHWESEVSGKHQKIKTHTGFEIDQSMYQSVFFSKTRDTTQHYAAYQILQIPFSTQVWTVAGLRIAKLDGAMEDQANAKEIGLHWKPNSHWQQAIRIATNYRFPKSDEVSFAASPLKTQTGLSKELSVTYQDRQQSFLLNAYQLSLKNEILFLPSIDHTSFGSYQNLNPTERRGLTLSEAWRWTPAFSSRIHYSYTQAFFKSGLYQNKTLPWIAKHQAGMTQILKWKNHWQWQISTHYLGHRYASGDFSHQAKRAESQWLWNTGIEYHAPKYAISFSIKNLMDRRYNNFILVNSAQPAVRYFYPASARSFLLSGRFFL